LPGVVLLKSSQYAWNSELVVRHAMVDWQSVTGPS
jgi:hypothetical protein